jgi:hypothetical protein
LKVLGIEIKGREIRIVALEDNGGIITDVTGNYKPIKLEDDENAENVKLFKNALHATLSNFDADIIAIRWRNPKPVRGDQSENNNSSSPISFKIEGLIQIYENSKVNLVKPQSSTAYVKKNPLPFDPKYGYQSEALKIAFYQIKNNK